MCKMRINNIQMRSSMGQGGIWLYSQICLGNQSLANQANLLPCSRKTLNFPYLQVSISSPAMSNYISPPYSHIINIQRRSTWTTHCCTHKCLDYCARLKGRKSDFT